MKSFSFFIIFFMLNIVITIWTIIIGLNSINMNEITILLFIESELANIVHIYIKIKEKTIPIKAGIAILNIIKIMNNIVCLNLIKLYLKYFQLFLKYINGMTKLIINSNIKNENIENKLYDESCKPSFLNNESNINDPLNIKKLNMSNNRYQIQFFKNNSLENWKSKTTVLSCLLIFKSLIVNIFDSLHCFEFNFKLI